MKKWLTGGLFALVGSVWALVIIGIAGNNLLGSWNTDLGRFWSTVAEYGLMVPFVIAVVLAVFGLVIVLGEGFRKD